jgi:hypothetical protein
LRKATRNRIGAADEDCGMQGSSRGGEIDGGGGQDTHAIDSPGDVSSTGARRTVIHDGEKGLFRESRTRDVTGDAVLQVTQQLLLMADEALVARQDNSSLTLVDGSASVAPDRRLRFSNPGGALSLEPNAHGTLDVKELRLVCGASQMVIGGGTIAIKAPAVVVRAAGAQVALDAGGAATTGTAIKSSAAVLNVIQGMPVIFSAEVAAKAAAPAAAPDVQTPKVNKA